MLQVLLMIHLKTKKIRITLKKLIFNNMSDKTNLVDFWFDDERYDNYISKYVGKYNNDPNDLVFSVDLIYLASARKAISNFVTILTNKKIPVYFRDSGKSMNVDGKSIYITTEIKKKIYFYVGVGLALHEGAHVIKTDFDMAKTMWANVPTWIWDFADKHKIRAHTMEKFLFWIWNVIEDRYIDNYVFSNAPGYRGYYVSLYDQYFNHPDITNGLNGPLFRYPSLESYKFRITNLTNPSTDLDALPGLEEIAKIIDLSNIDRLETTEDRIKTTYKVTEIIFKYLEEQSKKSDDSKKNKDKPVVGESGGDNNSEDFDPHDLLNDDDEPKTSDQAVDVVHEITNILGKKPHEYGESENKDITENVGDISNANKNIKKAVEKQKEFIFGQIDKDILSPVQKQILDLIEKHGIVLIKVGDGIISGNDKAFKVDCIVVNKMTKELILSGDDIFPMGSLWKDDEGIPRPDKETEKAVIEGITLGKMLGRRLKIRNEENPEKHIRKKHGKIHRHRLFAAGMDEEDIFEITNVTIYNKSSLHITVDASSSMVGDKWLQTMKSCVAICKATSMVSNIHVTVSFRTTQNASKLSNITLPYVVMAYDSKKDKFSKVKNLFPYLKPNGCTPEGLAFEAIMKLFENACPEEENRYFLNLSDGEPFYTLQIKETGMHMRSE